MQNETDFLEEKYTGNTQSILVEKTLILLLTSEKESKFYHQIE